MELIRRYCLSDWATGRINFPCTEFTLRRLLHVWVRHAAMRTQLTGRSVHEVASDTGELEQERAGDPAICSASADEVENGGGHKYGEEKCRQGDCAEDRSHEPVRRHDDSGGENRCHSAARSSWLTRMTDYRRITRGVADDLRPGAVSVAAIAATAYLPAGLLPPAAGSAAFPSRREVAAVLIPAPVLSHGTPHGFCFLTALAGPSEDQKNAGDQWRRDNGQCEEQQCHRISRPQQTGCHEPSQGYTLRNEQNSSFCGTPPDGYCRGNYKYSGQGQMGHAIPCVTSADRGCDSEPEPESGPEPCNRPAGPGQPVCVQRFAFFVTGIMLRHSQPCTD